MTAVPDWDIVSDADLVGAALSGDRMAFAGIYDRYADRLHDFCVGMVRDRDAAADCVQDVFCTAATALDKLREPDKLRPWLYAIARNEALRRIRQRRREEPSEELPDEASGDAGPDTLAARNELAKLVAEAAGGLSDRDRAVLELGYRPLEEFKRAGFGENRVLPEVAFKRYRAFENTRLTKLDLVLKAREELLKPREGPGKSALIIAAENEAQDALQREIEKQAAFKRAQQKKAEKEVRQVLLLQANAAEMAEKNRIRQEKEAVRAAEIEEEVKRQREQFNKRKQEMEKLKIEDERAHNQKLREEQLIRLEQEKRRIAKEEKEKKKRAKEILAKQKQKAERQREHKMMIEAKEQQRELLAEKRLQQMAEKDLVRKEAAELAQEEVAKRNAEMREYQ